MKIYRLDWIRHKNDYTQGYGYKHEYYLTKLKAETRKKILEKAKAKAEILIVEVIE